MYKALKLSVLYYSTAAYQPHKLKYT